MKKIPIFDNPLLKTRITSANVKPNEMMLGYLIGPLAALISNAVFASYLNRYYSDIIGWTDTARFGLFSALLPLLSVILVIIGNLFVGQLMERMRTKQGKARPLLLISAPLVMIAIVTLFFVPRNSSPVVQMVWIAVSYNLYYALTYPLYYTAHSSLVNLSTRNSKARGLLATLSNASNVAAVGIGASILIPMLLNDFLFVPAADGGIDAAASYANWQIMTGVLCAITLLGILIEYFFSRERITEETMNIQAKSAKVSMGAQINACVTEKYWWIIMAYFLLFQFGGLVKNGSMTYYCTWIFSGMAPGAAQGLLGLIGGIPTAVGMLIAWPIASKLGKQRAVTYGLMLSVAGGLVSFLNVRSFPIVTIGIVLKGVGSIPAMYVTLALLSDVLDHIEAKRGFRTDGFTMAVYGIIMVGMTGLASGIINTLLSSAGYDATLSAQSDSVQSVLVICYLGIELVCYTVLTVMMNFLKVEKHIKADQIAIFERQKAEVISAGGEWVEPAERLRREQEEAEALAEKARREELRAVCLKKGLDFDTEEARYQRKQAERHAKKGAKPKGLFG